MWCFFLVLFFGLRQSWKQSEETAFALLVSFYFTRVHFINFLPRFNIVTDYRTAKHAYAQFQLDTVETVIKHGNYVMNPKMFKAV